MTDKEINNKLCEALGVVPDKMEPICDDNMDNCPSLKNKKIDCLRCPHETPTYPDLRKPVDVICKDCEGKGGHMQDTGAQFPDGTWAQEWYLCPTCKGHPVRRIPLVQKVLEDRGEWNRFLCWLKEPPQTEYIQELEEILTDINALVRAVAKWSRGFDMDNWISVEDRLPEDFCLVYMEKETLGSNMAVANYNGKVDLVGGRFKFDCPTVTHWQPLPAPPEDKP